MSKADMDFEVMLAKSYDPDRVESWKETYIEPKLDGVRVIVTARRNEAPRYFTRNGRELGMFTHMDPSVRAVAKYMMTKDPVMKKTGVVLDTEAVGMTFGDVSGAIHTKGTVALTCRLHLFHAMSLYRFKLGHDSVTQLEQHEKLVEAIEEVEPKGLTVALPQRVLDHAQVMKAHNKFRQIDPKTGKPKFEGSMVKNLHVAWVAKRTWAWMKVKEEITVDVVVVDIKEGTGKYVGMVGALICDYKGKRIRASGIPDELREAWFKKPKLILDKMVEVSAQEETEHGSLRHPRFKRVRDDKQ